MKPHALQRMLSMPEGSGRTVSRGPHRWRCLCRSSPTLGYHRQRFWLVRTFVRPEKANRGTVFDPPTAPLCLKAWSITASIAPSTMGERDEGSAGKIPKVRISIESDQHGDSQL